MGPKIGQALAVMAVPAPSSSCNPISGQCWCSRSCIVMLFGAGISGRQILVLSGAGVGDGRGATGLLRDYQVDRIRVLMDPTLDPTGIGWNLRQSKLAVGSGQLTGKGLFQGQQTNFQYVPEQGTDFIFTAVGEQLGFVGGILVIAAFLVLVWRLLVIAANARDRFGALVALGIAAMFVFHVFVNIGMTIGIMPVTGLAASVHERRGSSFLNFSICVGHRQLDLASTLAGAGEVG